MVGSTVALNATVMNVGNALESSMDVGFTVSSSPPTTDLVAFLTAGIGGPISESGEVLTFPMGAGTSKLLFIDVVIGENVPLNTRIVVTIFVEGGFDDEGDIVREEHQNLIIVDQQRKVEMRLSDQDNLTLDERGELWFNITSQSTQTEDVVYAFAYPEDWQMMCDSALIANNAPVNVSLAFSRNSDSIQDIRCEVRRLSGSYTCLLYTSPSPRDG